MHTKIFVILTSIIMLFMLATPASAQKKAIKRQVSTVNATTKHKSTITKPKRNTINRGRSSFRQRRITEAECKQVINNIINNMVLVDGGTFTMGGAIEGNPDPQRILPEHKVTLSSYYIGKYEVTRKEWKVVMSGGGMTTEDDNNPMDRVGYDDVQDFISQLNQLTGRHFRLPTEAEWEFAASGGNKSHGYKYAGSDNPLEVSWTLNTIKAANTTYNQPVGRKKPNELGLYDMSGNVYEWVSDWYGNYSSEPQTNPKGPSSPSNSANYRTIRGGYWHGVDWESNVKYRMYVRDYESGNWIGFRLVMEK